MERPMFKDYASEEEAYQAVVKMNHKFEASHIYVIAPFPESNQTKTHKEYGLPRENVKYDGDINSLIDSLEVCGFNEEQAKVLRDNIDLGQVLVIICQDESL